LSPPPPHRRRRRRRRFSVVAFRIAGAHDHRRAADIVVRRSLFAVDGAAVDRGRLLLLLFIIINYCCYLF